MYWECNLKRFSAVLGAGLVSLLMGGCAADRQDQLVAVVATAETQPVPSSDDAADDSAIWVDPLDPAQSLIVATDKDSGLLLYNLKGEQRQHMVIGRLNNVDLRQSPWARQGSTLIAASRRHPSGLLLLSLDPRERQMKVEAEHHVELDNPYGICLYQAPDGQPYVILNDKDGRFIQYEVTADYGIEPVRTWRTAGQPEGCVVNDRNAALYLGEEARGIWRMSADPQASTDMQIFDDIAQGRLHPDVEGLALHHGEQTRLIASSQGDSTFVVYDAASGTHEGSFQISSSADIDGVTECDGIAVTAQPLPGYRAGLLVAHDDRNELPPRNQNFKLVSWRDVMLALNNKH